MPRHRVLNPLMLSLLTLAFTAVLLSGFGNGAPTGIFIYGEFQDVDGDGTRDLILSVIKIVPSDEVDYSKNEQFAAGAMITLDGMPQGVTNSTGELILYNLSKTDHIIHAEYSENGKVYTDTWEFVDVDQDQGNRAISNIGWIMGLIVAAFVIGALIVWGVDHFNKKTTGGKKKKPREWAECEECGAKVKTKNMDFHLSKVHKRG